jgi:hypothetical protein
MFMSPKYLALAPALLLAGLPVWSAEESSHAAPAAAVAPQAGALVNCPGMTSAPMTADAEQALPFRLISNLSCGTVVPVLSDNEGYTAHVRTAEGKDGFVARMYLLKNGTAPSADDQPATASMISGVARWQAGAPGCDQFMSQGRMVESITVNGITVQVSLQDTGWKLRVYVAISNRGEADLSVQPSRISLDELQPGLKPLSPENPAKLAHTTNRQVLWTQANARPSPSAVAFRANGSPAVSNLVYRPATPDYSSEQKGQPTVSADSSDVRALSLKPVSLHPGQKSFGAIWFARDTNARELSLRVPVGDMIFDFPLSFEQKK